MEASSKSLVRNLNLREIECFLPTYACGLASQAGNAPGHLRCSKNECMHGFSSQKL
jgi:hypothetical protein